MLSDDGPTFGSRSGTGDGAPPARPYIPFEGRSTAQDAYAPKVLSDDGPTFGSRSVGSGGPGQRPYVPFEGQSETQASFPYVGRCVALLRGLFCVALYCVAVDLCGTVMLIRPLLQIIRTLSPRCRLHV